jgi:hypothetical protein
MAWGLSLEAHIRVRDSKGKESTIKFNHPLNTDLGALKQTIRSTAALIDNLIRGQVIGASITLVVSLPGNLNLKATAIAGSDVEEGVRFAFSTSVGSQTLFRVPTINESWLTDAGVLDYDASDAMDDFIQRILQGVTQGLINASPSDAYGNDITAFVGGTESFLASRA